MLTPLVATLLWLVDTILWLYLIVVIVAVVASWLVAFGVINTYNHLVRSIMRALDALTEPVFRKIRRLIPPIGGLDLSPLVVLLAIQAIRMLLDGYGGRYVQ